MDTYIINEILLFTGGLSLFMLGLWYISENAGKVAGRKINGLLGKCSDNAVLGVLVGGAVTAVAQSSAAVDIVAIGMVESGIISLYGASAVIMGANVGTTVTAQIISLSGSSLFDVTAIGSLVALIGTVIKFACKENLKHIGEIMIGFGMLFIGLDIMGDSINCFKGFSWFRNIFLIDNGFILFLNGVALTALIQSSSAMTGIMAVLSNGGFMPFKNAMFLILGANVGSCFAVIVSSLKKGVSARQTAYFNLLFNLFGAFLFFFPLIRFGDAISAFVCSGRSVGRAIANFHTFFNLAVTFACLPLLKPFTGILGSVVKDKMRKNGVK